MEDVLEVGAEWLCKQTTEGLGVGDYLRSLKWNANNIKTALIQLISRAVYPGSERKTAQWINENSAVAELFNRQADTINWFKLYQMSRKLYHEKEGLEK